MTGFCFFYFLSFIKDTWSKIICIKCALHQSITQDESDHFNLFSLFCRSSINWTKLICLMFCSFVCLYPLKIPKELHEHTHPIIFDIWRKDKNLFPMEVPSQRNKKKIINFSRVPLPFVTSSYNLVKNLLYHVHLTNFMQLSLLPFFYFLLWDERRCNQGSDTLHIHIACLLHGYAHQKTDTDLSST